MAALSIPARPSVKSAPQGHRLNEQQRLWLLKMPAWTAVSGEGILRYIDGLVAENARLRAKLAEYDKYVGEFTSHA